MERWQLSDWWHHPAWLAPGRQGQTPGPHGQPAADGRDSYWPSCERLVRRVAPNCLSHGIRPDPMPSLDVNEESHSPHIWGPSFSCVVSGFLRQGLMRIESSLRQSDGLRLRVPIRPSAFRARASPFVPTPYYYLPLPPLPPRSERSIL